MKRERQAVVANNAAQGTAEMSDEEAEYEPMPKAGGLDSVQSGAAHLVHEIINPLTNLSLTVQLLERRIAKGNETADPVVLSMLQQMTKEVDRMQALISSFRESLSGRKVVKGE
jgi:signal transduction histidine kinase